MPKKLTIAEARKLIEEACETNSQIGGIVCKIDLMPVGGFDTKVYPPTYLGSKKGESQYKKEKRTWNGELASVATLDSVASSANRVETAVLKYCRTHEDFQMPDVLLHRSKADDRYFSILVPFVRDKVEGGRTGGTGRVCT